MTWYSVFYVVPVKHVRVHVTPSTSGYGVVHSTRCYCQPACKVTNAVSLRIVHMSSPYHFSSVQLGTVAVSVFRVVISYSIERHVDLAEQYQEERNWGWGAMLYNREDLAWAFLNEGAEAVIASSILLR